MRRLLELLIQAQEIAPLSLPNEYLVWKNYNRKFSKTCDVCHEQKGVYKITGQDPTELKTVLIPIPVRMCTNCLCRADKKVGIMSEEKEDGSSIEIERI